MVRRKRDLTTGNPFQAQIASAIRAVLEAGLCITSINAVDGTLAVKHCRANDRSVAAADANDRWADEPT